MHLVPRAAAALATGALLAAVPAAASASTPASGLASGGAPTATGAQFAQVSDGQTVAQVQQEMGSAGQFTQGIDKDHTDTTYLTWDSRTLGGVIKYTVTFSTDFGAPAVVSGKAAEPLV